MRVLVVVALCLGLAAARPDILGGVQEAAHAEHSSSSSSSSESHHEVHHSETHETSSSQRTFVSHESQEIVEITVAQAAEYDLECWPSAELTQAADIIIEEDVKEEGAAASSAAVGGGAASSAAGGAAAASSAAHEGGAAASSAAGGGGAASSAAGGAAAASSAAHEGAAASSAAGGGGAASSAASGAAAASSAAHEGAAASSAAGGGAAASSAAGAAAAASAGHATTTTTTTTHEDIIVDIGIYGNHTNSLINPLENCKCGQWYKCCEDDIIADGAGQIDIRFNSKPEENKAHSFCLGQLEEVCCTNLRSTICPDFSEELTYDYEPRCGKRNPKGLYLEVKGYKESESLFGEFPYMAIILEKTPHGDTQYVCGGSLIKQDVILTGGHCVNEKNAKNLIVRLGDWNTKVTTEIFPYEEFEVAHIEVHEKLNARTLFNDVALIFLKEKVRLQPHIDTICLPPPDAYADINLAHCVATGFGRDQFHGGTYQNIMKQVDLSTVDNKECQKRLRTTKLGRYFRLHSSFLCAGGEAGVDTCKGDGGSPLVCPLKSDPDTYVQVGIVAWGIGCGEAGIPGVYASVPKLLGWINEHLGWTAGSTHVDRLTETYVPVPVEVIKVIPPEPVCSCRVPPPQEYLLPVVEPEPEVYVAQAPVY